MDGLMLDDLQGLVVILHDDMPAVQVCMELCQSTLTRHSHTIFA